MFDLNSVSPKVRNGSGFLLVKTDFWTSNLVVTQALQVSKMISSINSMCSSPEVGFMKECSY